jgi:hypothetical protein
MVAPRHASSRWSSRGVLGMSGTGDPRQVLIIRTRFDRR